MRTPILSELKDRILSIRFYTQNGDSEYVLDLISEALDLIDQATEQVQGAREDAFRMAGRVQVCTELYDLLAPNELTFEQLIALHPNLEAAYGRLMRLDANGACCTATDIQDAVVYGHLSEPDAERFAEEINIACDAMERGEE